MGVELKKLGSLIGPKGEDGINGLTIKGELEPSGLKNPFPFNSKINDAYVISRNSKDPENNEGLLLSEYPSGAKRGDVYVCVKESCIVTSADGVEVTKPPVFEKKFNISWYGEYNDIHIMSTYDNYVVEGYDTDNVKINDIIIDNGNTLNSRLGNIYKVINVIEGPSDENNEGWEIVNWEDLKTGDKVVIAGYDSDVSSGSGLIGLPIFPEKVNSINTHKAYELVITETTENSGVYNISPKDEKSKYTEQTLSVDDFIFNVEIPNEEFQQIAFYVNNPDNPEDEKKYYLQVNGRTPSTLRIESSLNEETKSHLFELETDNTSKAFNYIKSLSTRTDNPVYISLYSAKTDGILGYVDWRHYAAGSGSMSNQYFKIYRMKTSIPHATPKVIVDTVASVNISQRNLYHSGNNISVKNNTISALGYNYNVSKLSFSEGNSTATGANSHAEGILTTASGVGSHAEGDLTIARGYVSHAEGYTTLAQGEGSHAEGRGTKAMSRGAHAEGGRTSDILSDSIYKIYQDADEPTKYHLVEEEGFETYVRLGMCFCYKNKYYYVTKIEYSDDIELPVTKYPEEYIVQRKPLAFWLNETINKAEGEPFTVDLQLGISYGVCTHSEGKNNTAYKDTAHAEGNTTRAVGNGAHAEGVETCALENYSHAEGQSTISVGQASHAEGMESISSGNGSHAEGGGCIASGHSSHAEGFRTEAISNYSHAEGICNLSNNGEKFDKQTISSIGIGSVEETKVNPEDPNSNTIRKFHRKNAVEVMRNGDVYIHGIGDYDGTNSVVEEGEVKAKTLQEVVGELSNGASNNIPIATTDELGVIKVGENLTISEDGTLSASKCPIATTDELGVIKVGENLTISEDGTLSASKCPNTPHSLIYSLNDEHIGMPLMYTGGFIVDDESEMEVCKGSLDNLMSNVLSSWTPYGSDYDKYRWGYCDSKTGITGSNMCNVPLVGNGVNGQELTQDVPIFTLNGKPQDYIFNTLNTNGNTGYISPKKYSNYDNTITCGILPDLHDGSCQDYLAVILGINAKNNAEITKTNISSTTNIVGMSLHAQNLHTIDPALPYPGSLDGRTSMGLYDFNNQNQNQYTASNKTTLQLIVWNTKDNTLNTGVSSHCNIPIISYFEGTDIIPFDDNLNNYIGTKNTNNNVSCIKTRLQRTGNIIKIWSSLPTKVMNDDNNGFRNDNDIKILYDRGITIDLENYILTYTDKNGNIFTKDFKKNATDEGAPVWKSGENGEGQPENKPYTQNQINAIREIFDSLKGSAHFGYEAESNPGTFYRNSSEVPDKILRTYDDTVWELTGGTYTQITDTSALNEIQSGSRLAFNKVTGKLFYNEGTHIYQIADIANSDRLNAPGVNRPSTQPSYSAEDNIDITDDVISVTGMPQVYEEGDNITLENTTNDEGKSVLKINGLSKNAITYNPERKSIALQYNEEDGAYNEAQADYSVVMGWNNKAIREEPITQPDGSILVQQGANSLVGGMDNRVYHSNSFVFGEGLFTQFGNTFVLGKYNGVVSNQDGGGDTVLGIVGDGYKDSNGNVTRRNVLLLQGGGDPALHCRGGFKNNASWINDFGEYFEWLDGNPDNEDRIGYMVQVNGNKIELAQSFENCVGVISGTTGFIGGVCAFEWHHKFLRDEWGREIIGEDGNPIISPDYNPELEYIPREKRKEWDVVGLIGQVLTRQDGTLKAGGFAGCKDGIATNSTYGYRVLKVINENIALLLIK